LVWGWTAETGAGASPARHHIKTGSQIPVEIIAEVDRKIDDGDALKGGFQFSFANQYGIHSRRRLLEPGQLTPAQCVPEPMVCGSSRMG